jgi:spermidine/putrescine ABC transporter ATP-binding subunit
MAGNETDQLGPGEQDIGGRSVELRLEGITKRFGSMVAVKSNDLVVPAGKLTALLGPSGCGKSTTLRIIAGFEAPDEGRVLIDGRDVVDVPPNRRNLGMVFQDYSLFPHMTIWENVAFGLQIAKRPRTEVEKRVADALALVKLNGLAERYPSQISGGQRQRAALARSLVMRPTILLLDEPLGALDKNLREFMQFELRRIQQELGITTVLVTHDQEEALTLADEVAVMDQGSILQVGSPHDIYEFPRSRFVSEFLGTANLFEAEVTGHAQDGLRATRLVHWKAEHRVLAPCHGDDRRVTVGVRPEKMSLSKRPVDGMNCIPATVEGMVFRGSYRAFSLRAEGLERELFVYEQSRDRTAHSESAPGDAIWACWLPQASFVLDRNPSAGAH